MSSDMNLGRRDLITGHQAIGDELMSPSEWTRAPKSAQLNKTKTCGYSWLNNLVDCRHYSNSLLVYWFQLVDKPRRDFWEVY